MNPKKTAIIQNIPVPKTVKDVRSFLGLTNYHRRFIQDYGKICTSLHSLCSGSSNDAVFLTEEHLSALGTIKDKLAKDIVLAHPVFDRPFSVTTDASYQGIGAVLSQTDAQGLERPIW